MRTASYALVAVALLLAAPVAWAESLESLYIAARDNAIRAINEKAGPGPISDALSAEEQRLRDDLEVQLRRIVSPIAPAGFASPPTMSPDTLFDGDIGMGELDGLRFDALSSSGHVLVTTKGLLQYWLQRHKNWWKDQRNPPTDPVAAFRSEAFYTQSWSDEAAISIFAPVPIRQPVGTETAVALLIEESQDLAIYPPSQIAVSVIKGEKVFIAIVDTTPLPPIAACTALWKSAEARAKTAHAVDLANQLESQGEAAFKQCWAERVHEEDTFVTVTQQAQALVDALAAP